MTTGEKKQFWQNNVSAKTKQYINLGGGVACVTGVMTIIFALALNPLMWLDAILTLGLAIGILVKKNRICAVVMLVYFIISKLMQLGMMSVWSFMTAAAFITLYILGVIGTFQYHDQLLIYEKEQAEAVAWAKGIEDSNSEAVIWKDEQDRDERIYYEENE